MTNKYFLTVDYDEFEPETYKGVCICTIDNKELKRVYTGNFIEDIKSIIEQNECYYPLLTMSDLDNYIMDYEIKYNDEIFSHKINKLMKEYFE